MRAVLVLLFGFFGTIISPAMAEQPLVVEETFLTVTIGRQDYRLEALIAKEAGSSERLPVALITHGQAVEAEKREQIEARGFLPLAREFARRGWLAVVVVRRGFGHSEGPTPYVLKQCRNGDYAASLAAQTDDIEAAMKAVGPRNDADISTVLALGISVGGAAVLDLAARRPEGLKAVVSVAGGIKTFAKPGGPPPARRRISFRCSGSWGSARVCQPSGSMPRTTAILRPITCARCTAYIARGGRAEFHMFEPIGQDGHSIALSFDGMLRWLPALDRFLRDHQLRTYDPAPLTAALGSLHLPDGARQVAKRYDGRPTEKAFAVSQSNKVAYAQFGGRDLSEMEAKAREECEKRAKEPCRIFLRNFEVVPDGH
jgi:pimeloyl-ACP methyl ester carboxylesterase